MLLSHNHKFIFFKTAKTAGTAVQNMIQDMVTDEFILGQDVTDPNTQSFWTGWNNIRSEWIQPDWGHNSARIVKYVVNEKTWNYFKFAIIKNPWHCQVSWWYHIQSLIKENEGVNKYRRSKLIEFVGNKSFPEFVIESHKQYIPGSLLNFTGPILDDGDNPCMDYYIKYENLIPDLNIALKRSGLPQVTQVPISNKHSPDNKPHWSELYDNNAEAIDIIYHRNKQMVELGNYTFAG